MTNAKSDHLGLRGRLAHYESALRLLGGANATGAIAAGAAYHAFAQNAVVRTWVSVSATLFLFGILIFVLAYIAWFVAVEEIDHSLHKADEPVWPEYLFWIPSKTAEQYKSDAKNKFFVMFFAGLASFISFLVGLASVLMMAVLQVGPN